MNKLDYHKPERMNVTKSVFYCDGSGGEHPRVYLKIDEKTNQSECPYCDRVFEYQPGLDGHNAGHH